MTEKESKDNISLRGSLAPSKLRGSLVEKASRPNDDVRLRGKLFEAVQRLDEIEPSLHEEVIACSTREEASHTVGDLLSQAANTGWVGTTWKRNHEQREIVAVNETDKGVLLKVLQEKLSYPENIRPHQLQQKLIEQVLDGEISDFTIATKEM